MKTDIWHLPTDVPENGREILCMRENKWATGWGKKYTVRNAKNKINPSYDAYITKWCYLDELIEQSSKIERLESQVDRYKNALANIMELADSWNNTHGGLGSGYHQILQITQALDKKE